MNNPEDLTRYVFDLETVTKIDPALHWQGREFAVMGVFLARRNVFSEHRLMSLARLGCWRCYEQGLLNYLLWRGLQDGSPRMGGHRFQVFPPETSMRDEDRFLPPDWNQPVVIHWLGKKPKLGRHYLVEDVFRSLFLTMTGKQSLKRIRLLLEDLRWVWWRQTKSLKRRLSTAHR